MNGWPVSRLTSQRATRRSSGWRRQPDAGHTVHEMSAIVAGLGSGVADLAAGDEVIGLIDFDRDGAAAEHVVMAARSSRRVRRRRQLSSGRRWSSKARLWGL